MVCVCTKDAIEGLDIQGLDAVIVTHTLSLMSYIKVAALTGRLGAAGSVVSILLRGVDHMPEFIKSIFDVEELDAPL